MRREGERKRNEGEKEEEQNKIAEVRKREAEE